ncbi:MAG: FAD-dependent oxidoreductase [Thermoleophilia bacterium]
MKDIFLRRRMWRSQPELKRRYDVVIVGGGAHGLATAYYLVKNHGVTSVCVLEKSYIGAGGSGRNTTIIRSNYRTPEGAEFYRESVRLYEELAQDLDYNLMFSQHGHLTLAHSDRGMITSAERAEVNQLLGIESHVVDRAEVKRLCPQLNLDGTYPVYGALYHPPGGIIRHDAVVWGYARGADRGGVDIHQGTEVTGIDVVNGKVTGVQTSRGRIETDTVISCVAGWSSSIADMVGLKLPLWTTLLHACVTEPVKPFLDVIIVSGQLHVYISQTDRGEFLMGSGVDGYPTYSKKSTLPSSSTWRRRSSTCSRSCARRGSSGSGRATAT